MSKQDERTPKRAITPESEEERLARLESKGIIRRPEKMLDLAEWRKLPRPFPDPEGHVLKELLSARREGR